MENSRLISAIFLIGCLTVLEATVVGSISYHRYCQQTSISNKQPGNCLELLCRGYTSDGVYDIYPNGRENYKISVYCDQTTTGGGWTVFQRRMDGTVDFYRNWMNYRLGFGEVNTEHWLGLDNIHNVVNTHTTQQLRIDLEDFDNAVKYAEYNAMSISGKNDDYKITISGFSGNAGDSLARQNNQKFSTNDRDQDVYGSNCAELFKGGWWYSECHDSNLNGQYLRGNHTSFADGVNWRWWKGYNYSLKTTEMKIRPSIPN